MNRVPQLSTAMRTTAAVFTLLVGLASFAFAQTPERRALPAAPTEGAEQAEAPPEAGAPGAASAIAASEGASLPETLEVVTFADDGTGPVLDFLERLTDRIILRPQDLPQVRINFDSRGPISRLDAILAIESLLALNGIMVTELGGRFLKAVPAANVSQQVPELIMGSTLDLAPSQRIYAKLFQIEYLESASQATPIIQPLLSGQGTSSIVNFEKSNALLITDALVNLQRVETILKDADQAQAVRGQIEFVQLQFVGAEEVQRRLEALITGPLKNNLQGNTSITADERTNQLIVISPSRNFELIESLIEKIDVDAAPLTQTEVLYMRQAQATEVVTLIRSVIDAQEAAQRAERNARAESGRSGQSERSEEGGQAPQPSSENGGDARPPAPEIAETVVTSLIESTPSLQFSSFVGLAADERTNSIVAYGTRTDLRTIRDLVERIDIPLPQVRIEAIITEVTLSDNEAFGLERFGFTYNPAAAADITVGGPLAVAGSNGGVSGPGFDLGGSLRPFTLQGVIRAAETTSDVRVLSTPSIVVSHNEEAVISVSERRPFITGSTSDLAGGTATRSTVEFRDIGINLTVQPLIGSDGTVQMIVEQIVENVVDTTTIDGNEQPITGRREARSTVSVQDRDIIILGGLQENRRTVTDNRWPLVGRLPVVGRVFGGENEEFRRTELIIFLRPTILVNPASGSQLARERLNLSTERDPVDRFLETGVLGNTYMEGSRLEQVTPDHPTLENGVSREE